MGSGDSFRRSNLLNLADKIASKVSCPYGIKIDETKWTAEILVFMNLSHDKIATGIEAHCKIIVYDDWGQFMPDVQCREHWVKRETDWHVSPDGTLCYDLDLRWRDKVGFVLRQDGIRAASIFASEWCIHHSRVLLWRHYCAYTNNIEIWPTEWPAWGHGEKGRSEYRLSKLQKREC